MCIMSTPFLFCLKGGNKRDKKHRKTAKEIKIDNKN